MAIWLRIVHKSGSTLLRPALPELQSSKHFSKLLKKNVAEPSVRQFKGQYVMRLKELRSKITDSSPVLVKALPQKN